MQFKRLLLAITFSLNLLLAGFAQEPTFLDHGGGVRTVEFSPVNASLVASAGESNIIKLWDLQNDTVQTLRGHTDRVNSIAFSLNGELLASVSDDGTIKLWSVYNQQNIATLQDGTRFRSVAFSPDGQLLATGGGMHVKLWNVRRRAEIAILQHDKSVWTVAFSHAGQLLAAGDASRDGSGTVKIWNVRNQQVIATLKDDLVVVRAVTFSSDDRYLASSHYNGEVKVWDVSDWERLHTIPQAGDYDIAFSPDGKMIAGTSNGYVSILWTEEGTRAARLPGPIGWIHPVDFSHDRDILAVGAEDGIIRIWRIDTSSMDGDEGDTVQILHIDTYLQELPKANSANGDHIPEPVPPPAVVRDFFDLDPFYKQWIDVGGLPVLGSGKVNPYAIKEAAWLIGKMIGHRPDVLRAMAGNKARFSVIAHTEIITEIPEYRSDPRPNFLVFRERGWGGTEGATASASEEDILNYLGSFAIRYEALIHEFAHAIHLLGFNTLDPTFDERLLVTYEAAIKNGLWQGTYASSDRREYWAEASHAWFHPKGAGSFDLFGNTRQALKQYDPGLATLLAEVYGDKDWQYTPVETRTHQPHLQGFNPQDSPAFEGWPELAALYRQLSDPNSDGGEWINLKTYNPKQLPRLTKLNVLGDTTVVVFVNFTQADILVYWVAPNGTEEYWTRVPPGYVRGTPSKINQIWLVKDANERNIVVFQAERKTGRAAIRTAINKRNPTTQLPPPKATENVNSDDLEPQVLIARFQRPPMYWIDAEAGTLHRLVDVEVENLVPSVQNATSLAVDTTRGTLYWTTKTNEKWGKIYRVNLKETPRIKELRDLYGIPLDIAVDPQREKLYWIDALNRIQRSDLNAQNIQNIFRDLKAPQHITLDVGRGKLYWTEKTGDQTSKIRSANIDGSNVQLVKEFASVPRGFIVDAVNGRLYLTNADGKVQRLNVDGSNFQPDLIIDLDAPEAVSVGVAGRKIYWTESDSIRRADLNGDNIEDVVTGLGAPTGIVLGSVPPAAPAAPATAGIPPGTTVLLANYPNPFNPETWIPYQLAKASDVQITIYDTRGVVVRQLNLGHQPPGFYTSPGRAAYWDGRNALGERVASAVYFYQLQTDDISLVRNMLIRK